MSPLILAKVLIIGRNSFQRSKPDALRLLNTIMDIYNGQSETIRTPALT
ncbi:hypothetical protein [uncultured Nostoc sp.]|nr:hypothetical protein [uncultured Nostoc sp.]